MNNWMEKVPGVLEARLDDAVGYGKFPTYNEIPLSAAIEYAKAVINEYEEEGTELYKALTEEDTEAQRDYLSTVRFVKRWEIELYKNSTKDDTEDTVSDYAKRDAEVLENLNKLLEEENKNNSEKESIENEDDGNTSSINLEGNEDAMARKKKEEVKQEEAKKMEGKKATKEPKETKKGEAKQNKVKLNEDEKFKWLNRPKATMEAVKLKHEEGITAEEACKRIMKEYVGTYLKNPENMSEKRWLNFIERVEADKTYKLPKTVNPEYKIGQKAIATLLEHVELTELQAITLDGLLTKLSTCPVGVSTATIESVADITGLKPEQVKGTLGHLIKKGYIYTETVESEEGEKQTLIFLDKEKYSLYNEDILESIQGLELEKIKAEDEAMDEDEVNV